MRFTKMHGLGNDYIFLDCMKRIPGDLPGLARCLSHRHFGVGGDGIICVCPSQRADFRMRMFNADGSEGAMCGNGIRCFGKYVYDKGLTDKRHLTIETGAGERELSLLIEHGAVTGAAVGMGAPVLGAAVALPLEGCHRGGRPRRPGAETPGPAGGAPPRLPPSGERRVRPGAGPEDAGDAGVGAGQRRDLGLRHRGVRRRRRHDLGGKAGPGGGGPPGRGRTEHPLGRGIGPNVHDRSRRRRI